MSIHDAERIVVKIGSSTLTHPTGLINYRQVESLVITLSDIINSGKQLILVTSGAVAVGMSMMLIKQKPSDIPTRQAIAAIGQSKLMSLYQAMFIKHHRNVGQILLSRDVTDNDHFKQNVKNTINKLIEMNAVPIVNENDSICVDELAYGDNDTLSSIVAVISESDSLVLLTYIDGIYSADPSKYENAELIQKVGIIDENIMSIASDSSSNIGTGGMKTKLIAARYAQKHDIDTYIINGNNPKNLYKLFDGEKIGTHILKGSDLK